MTFKSLEIYDFSVRNSTVLVSLLVSSSSCHALLPLVVRPMRTVREMFLKILINSPALNRSIIFSMHLISMTKKNQFLRNFMIGERIFSWFNIGPRSLPNRNCSWRRAGRFSSLCFALAFDRHAKSFASSSNSSQTCLIHVKSSLFTYIILISTPCLHASNWL